MRSRTAKREKELKALLERDHTLNGGIIYGIDGYVVEIQARAVSVLRRSDSWNSATRISGMAKGAVTECLDRISGAFSKLRIPQPEVEILLNLAPPDLPKDGTWLDLPIAIIMLQAAGELPDLPEHLEGDYVLMGELGLHGEVRRVPGALSLATEAKPGQKLIVPTGNEKECALILAKPGHEGCGVFAVSLLQEVIDFFRAERKLNNALRERITFEDAVAKSTDFGKIRGQERAKRAAMIAAAGGHNLLLVGPPGEGKSLLASAIPGILPRLTDAEKVELTRIHSACGKLERDGMAVTRRPFRTIHHSASKESLVGGGSGLPRPGEITLAHLGVLFLDEIAEFSRGTLEAIRQPLEAGEVHLTRVKGSLSFPARFTLVAAMNPCPCGYYGTGSCRCTANDVSKYQRKLSGPILDRIDLQVDLERLSMDERFAKANGELSAKLRQEIQNARNRQHSRFEGTNIPFNAAIPGGHVMEYVNFSGAAIQRYKSIVEQGNISTRSMDRLAKVARTVADLSSREQVEENHVDEAASFVVGGMLRQQQ